MKISDWFKPQIKSISLKPTSSVPAQLIFRFVGGVPVVYFADNTDTYLREGFEGNHVVFTIADWCARKMTTIPPILYDTKDKGAAKDYKYLREEGSFHNYLEARKIKGAAFKEVKEHGLLDLLRNPNPLMSGSEFMYGLYIYKKFVGKTDVQGIATENGLNKGKIQELWLLPSNYIKPVGGQGLNIIDHYQDSRNPSVKIPTEQILEIRNFSADYRTPGAHLQGMSVLKAATKLLQRSNDSMDASTESFQNRGARDIIFPKDYNSISGGGLTLPDNVTIDQINQDTRKRLREAGNQGIVVNTIPLDKITIGMSPTDLGTLESDKLDAQAWASLFHVDSRVVLNDHQSSTKDNMQTARLDSLVDGVFPELEAIKNGWNDWLLPTWDEKGSMVLDYDYTIIPEIQMQLRETAAKMNDAGVFTIDEIREVWKYGQYTGKNGDKVLVSTTKQILDDMDSALEDAVIPTKDY